MGSILQRRKNTLSVRNFQEFETEKSLYSLILKLLITDLWSLLLEHMRQLNSVIVTRKTDSLETRAGLAVLRTYVEK